MALSGIIPKEQRQHRSALENAALGLGLAQSLGNIASIGSDLFKKVGSPVSDVSGTFSPSNYQSPMRGAYGLELDSIGKPLPKVWDPMKYSLRR